MGTDTKKKLEKWVKENYKQSATGYTYDEGNFSDCFDDGFEYGYESGISWAVYEIGCILGMELEKPEEPKKEW